MKKKNLANTHPHLIPEWHPVKNENLMPKDVTQGSGKKVWWRCQKGHEWNAVIATRSKGAGCPYCSGRRTLNENKLFFTHPELSKEWHPTKNESLKSSDVSVGVHLKVWWQCDKKHEWEATIASRHYSKTGCPTCRAIEGQTKRRLKLIEKEGSLVDNFPELVEEWDFEKNTISPYEVTSGNSEKVGWVCRKCNYNWETRIYQRTGKNSGCPKCMKIEAGKRRSKYHAEQNGSLADKYPDVMKEWHPVKNKGLNPKELSVGSNKKAWWKCKKGHEWETAISHRTISKTSCPECFKKSKSEPKPERPLKNNYRRIFSEIHPQLNMYISMEELMSDSKEEIWWQCPKNEKHVYQLPVSERTKNKKNCPYCSKTKVLKEESFGFKHPEIMKEWDWGKNTEIDPFSIFPHFKKDVWWKCSKNPKHNWKTSPHRKINKKHCPYCYGSKTLKEESFGYLYPSFLKQWHPNKNNEIDPFKVPPNSSKKVLWVCDKNEKHTWKTTIGDRTKGRNCPYCAGVKLLEEESFLSMYPEIAKEWDYEKNSPLNPGKVTIRSGRKVWWKCLKNPEHEWNTTVASRTGKGEDKGSGCPYCAGQKAAKDNNLLIVNPKLASEWDYEKNGDLRPEDFLPRSQKKVWWKCDKNHESWKTSISHRTIGTQCPKCSAERQTSFEEQTIYYYFKKIFPNASNRDKITSDKKSYEVDIFIPDYNFAIEFDGIFHNLDPIKNKRRDEEKNLVLRKKNIQLIRIRDSKLPSIEKYNSIVYEYNDQDYDSLKQAIIQTKNILLELNEVSVSERKKLKMMDDIDIDKDKIRIMSFYKKNMIENSFGSLFPDIAKDWHPTKNETLKPEQFSPGSNFKAWWICEKGHDYQVSVRQKAKHKTGCPYCAGQRATKENNLKAKFPEIAKTWSYVKNKNKKPNQVMPFIDKKYWWVCEKNNEHVWYQSVNNRVKGKGCPYCYDKKTIIVTYERSLAYLYPTLSSEWHPTKNGDLKPENVSKGSNKKVWWQCSINSEHEWESSVNNRVKGNGCPYCAGKKVDKHNSLAFVSPEIAAEWHPTKNGVLKPTEVTANGNRKIWWKCLKNSSHEWESSMNSRNRSGKFRGCPYCSGAKTSIENSIYSTHSNLLNYWDYDKNTKVNPKEVSFGSEKKVNWKCNECNHEWNQTITSRVNSPYNCPKCKDKKDS